MTDRRNSRPYLAGFDAKTDEIRSMGFAASRDKFNADHPHRAAYSADGWMYAMGELDALHAAKN